MPNQPITYLYTMAIILTIGYLLLFTGIIFKWRFLDMPLLKRRHVLGIFVIKVLLGVGMYYIYSEHYTDRSTADIFKYFDDSEHMYAALDEHPEDYFRMLTGVGNDSPHFDQYYSKMNNWYQRHGGYMYNDSHTIIRFNALIRIFSGGYFHVHTIFMCFLSLIGMIGLFKSFAPRMPGKEKLLALMIFAIPSVLFWTSGVLKEGMLVFGVGMFLYGVFNLIDRKHFVTNLIIVLASAFLLTFIKVYVLLAMIPAIAGFMIARNGKLVLVKYVGIWIIAVLVGMTQHHVTGKMNVPSILVQKQQDFINIGHGGIYLANDTAVFYVPDSLRQHVVNTGKDTARIEIGAKYFTWNHGSKDTTFQRAESPSPEMVKFFDNPASGSFVHIPKLEPNFWSLVTAAPRALVNTLFRPFIWEAEGALMLFAALENLLLIGMIILVAFFAHRPRKEALNLILFCSTIAFAVLLLTGWVTPVLGAIVRYKVPALPFLGIILILILDKDRLLRVVPFLNKFLK